MNDFIQLLKPYNIFLIPIIVGTVTQTLKFIIYSIKNGWDFRYIMTHGHMPSFHTAFVTSMATSVGFYEGIHSGAFTVAVVIALIVIDDAVRLRVYIGDQGRYLNTLVQQLELEKKFPRLKERVGHRVSEVIAGGVFGFLLTILFITLLS
jgi:acid phosphatase family membrane protein YuiD